MPATAMRLVPAADVPRALAILNGGNALATVIAAPAGSYLGGVIGWRDAFFCLVPVAVVQLAIMLGATLGGLLFDASGYRATFGLSAGLLVAGAVIALLAGRAAGSNTGSSKDSNTARADS